MTSKIIAATANIFTTGRYSYDEARRLAEISGDTSLAEGALKNLLVYINR